MSTFLTDAHYADARDALSVTGLPIFDVAIDEVGPFEAIFASDILGAYDRDADSLWMRPGKASLIAGVHEYAHAIWYHRHERHDPHIRAVMAAVDASNLAGMRQRYGDAFKRSFGQSATADAFDYVFKPTEEFARATAQYVFTHPKQRADLRELWRTWFADPENFGYLAMQWPDEDFEPIATTFERAFPHN